MWCKANLSNGLAYGGRQGNRDGDENSESKEELRCLEYVVLRE